MAQMNTYAQAAAKLGVSKSFVKRLAQNGKIEVVDMGHRTKLITDSAIERFKESRTRGGV